MSSAGGDSVCAATGDQEIQSESGRIKKMDNIKGHGAANSVFVSISQGAKFPHDTCLSIRSTQSKVD